MSLPKNAAIEKAPTQKSENNYGKHRYVMICSSGLSPIIYCQVMAGHIDTK